MIETNACGATRSNDGKRLRWILGANTLQEFPEMDAVGQDNIVGAIFLVQLHGCIGVGRGFNPAPSLLKANAVQCF
jgi:hypothetical protein